MRRDLGWAAIVFAVLVAGQAAPTQAASRSTLSSRLKQVQASMAREKALVASLEAQKSGAEAVLAKLDNQLGAAQNTLLTAQTGLAHQQARLALLDQRLEQARLAAAQQRASLAAFARATQETSPLAMLAPLVEAQSFGVFVSRLSMVSEVLSGEGHLLHRANAIFSSVSALHQQAQAAAAAMYAQEQAANRAAAEASSLVLAKRQAVVSLRVQAQVAENNIETDQATANALTKLMEQPSVNAHAQASSNFIWPVVGPITSPFGPRVDPITHRQSFHTGIDIGVPMGTKVAASQAGTVILAGWVTGYGNTVILDDGGGIDTLYAHAEKLLVHVGEQVTQGQIIDLAGMTGWATGPHVHFEIRVNGVPKNPLDFLPPKP